MTEETDKVYAKELSCGEVYETTLERIWSDFDNKNKHITVPPGQRLIFRSFQPYSRKNNTELALFVWLEERKTICLSISSPDCYLEVKHIPWEERHTSTITAA